MYAAYTEYYMKEITEIVEENRIDFQDKMGKMKKIEISKEGSDFRSLYIAAIILYLYMRQMCPLCVLIQGISIDFLTLVI